MNYLASSPITNGEFHHDSDNDTLFPDRDPFQFKRAIWLCGDPSCAVTKGSPLNLVSEFSTVLRRIAITATLAVRKSNPIASLSLKQTKSGSCFENISAGDFEEGLRRQSLPWNLV